MEKMNEQDRRVHQRFSEYGRSAREWMRRWVLLLPEVERRRIWKKRGCGSIYEYAAKLAGMGRGTVEEALRVLRRIEDKPELQKVVEEKGLQRVRAVASVATAETAEFWAEKVRTMSKHSLETYVQNFRLESLPREETQSVKLTMELSPVVVEKLKVLKGAGSWEECMEKLLSGAAPVKVEAPEIARGASGHIPAGIERFVEERTGGLCAYPGCTREATSLHHTQRWGLEKVHDPARLHALCTGHERLAHLGLIENEEQAPRDWRLRASADPNAHKRFIEDMVALYRPT